MKRTLIGLILALAACGGVDTSQIGQPCSTQSPCSSGLSCVEYEGSSVCLLRAENADECPQGTVFRPVEGRFFSIHTPFYCVPAR